jgi:hypothetical protein
VLLTYREITQFDRSWYSNPVTRRSDKQTPRIGLVVAQWLYLSDRNGANRVEPAPVSRAHTIARNLAYALKFRRAAVACS